jgi:tetratricopeptide (TPR) repeat protein
MSSPSREIAERARVHVHLCEQKLSKPAPPPKTPADYYNLGVAALNARNLDQAIQLLGKADKAAPNRDEIRFALAAAHALMGNTDAAFEHLEAAIALRPENRYLARHDEDLEPLRADPRFRNLLQADRETRF